MPVVASPPPIEASTPSRKIASTPASKTAKLSNDLLQKLYGAFVSRKVPPGIDEELKDIDANIIIIRAEMRRRGLPLPDVMVAVSIPTATNATPAQSATKVEEIGKGSAAITTIEDFRAKNPIQTVGTNAAASTAADSGSTAADSGLSMNMKLGIAAIAAVGGFYLWKNRSA